MSLKDISLNGIAWQNLLLALMVDWTKCITGSIDLALESVQCSLIESSS